MQSHGWTPFSADEIHWRSRQQGRFRVVRSSDSQFPVFLIARDATLQVRPHNFCVWLEQTRACCVAPVSLDCVAFFSKHSIDVRGVLLCPRMSVMVSGIVTAEKCPTEQLSIVVYVGRSTQTLSSPRSSVGAHAQHKKAHSRFDETLSQRHSAQRWMHEDAQPLSSFFYQAHLGSSDCT